MSIQEVILRTNRFVRATLRRSVKRDIDLRRVLKGTNTHTLFYFDATQQPRIRKEFSKLFPRRIVKIANQADRLCSHNFKVFDVQWDAGSDIDWRGGIFENIRFVWEFNRHQHFVTLAKAYFLTGNKKYAREVKDQMLSWITQNPPYTGINWISSLELSLRLISWCWTYKFIEPSGIFTQEDKACFLKSVYMQAEFIRNNLSGYSSANNHLIGEACGLVITGLTFPEFKDARKWLDKGKKILFREIMRQTYRDGVTKEQAFGYQGFIMESFLLTATLLIKNDIEIPEDVLDRYFNMCEFIMNVMDKAGEVPNVGDSDNARAALLSEESKVFKSILSSASIFSKRGDFKTRGNGFGEEHYWLFGMRGFNMYESTKETRLRLDSMLFKEGGYAVFRGGSSNGSEKVLMMDCGQLGYLSIAAHGHADLLSVTLSVDGVRLLIDPGTYLYHSEDSWRNYFRGTSAHNTFTVNSVNQSEITGPFMWGKRPVSKINKWESSKDRDYVDASYNNPQAKHRRIVSFDKKKESWFIEDFLNAKGTNTVEQYFHLAHGSKVARLETNVIEVQNGKVFLYLVIDGALSVEIKQGESSPIAGWVSDAFGVKRKSLTLVNTATIRDRGKFDTMLYVSNKRLDLGQLERDLR